MTELIFIYPIFVPLALVAIALVLSDAIGTWKSGHVRVNDWRSGAKHANAGTRAPMRDRGK